MKSFKHINARSVENLCLLLEQYQGKTKLNAGGTDLLLVLKDSILPEYPELIVNIKKIPDLNYISNDDEFIKIGALTTLNEICRCSFLQDNYPVLTESAKSVASPQLRNVATIGGNLCQDVRCWYYRYSSKIGGPLKCLRKGNGPCLAIKGDNRYHAVIGGKKCFAVCLSDTAIALTALDASVILKSKDGERSIPVQDLYSPLGVNIKKNEFLKEIIFPTIKNKNSKQNFIKFTLRKPIDYAIVNVASVLELKKDRCSDVRIVLGGVAPKPFRAIITEEFIKGKILNKKNVVEAAEKALSEARPLSKNSYKIDIAKQMIKTALLDSKLPS